MEVYFFDTYAFHEMVVGNKDYEKYRTGAGVITTKLNLMELHYTLLSRYGKEKADFYYDLFLNFVVEIEDDVIKLANNFRYSLRKRGVSYVDCLGYTIAKLRGIKFLTGDSQFQDLENVEFVR